MLTRSIQAISRTLAFVVVERAGGEEGRGTAYLVSTEGHAVTSAHLVERADRIRLQLLGRGAAPPLEAEVVEAEARTDLALLRVRDRPSRSGGGGGRLERVSLHRGEPIALGTEVCFMGFPHSDLFRPPLAMAVRGIVGNRYAVLGVDRYVVDAMCTEGMSGGPLFVGATGDVVGTIGSRFDPSRTRAKLAGADEAALRALAAERTNITFATASESIRSLLGRHGVGL